MGDENTKGFRKSKLEDIVEESEQKTPEEQTGKENETKLNDEKTEDKTHENELHPSEMEVTKSEGEELPGENRDEDLKESLDESRQSSKKSHVLISSKTEYETDTNAETTDTEYSTTEVEDQLDSDLEVKEDQNKESDGIASKLKEPDTDEDEREAEVTADGEGGEETEDPDDEKYEPQSRNVSSIKQFNYEYALREKNMLVIDVINDIIQHIIPEGPEPETPEDDVGWKKKRPPRIIDDIKVNIDDLGKRYSEHGTEIINPISHLWKKGKAKYNVLEKIKSKQTRKIRGESYTSINPFVLKWAHGFSVNVPILNLCKKNKIKVGMACGHSFVVFNYKKKKVRLFQGHRNLIQSIHCDLSGKWVVSADGGNDNTLTIWDLKRCIPIKTYFSPHPEGIRLAAFDTSSSRIVTVSFGQQVISLWDWTEDKKSSEASFWLSSKTPPIEKICFSRDHFNYWALMTTSSIITCTYCDTEKKITVYISKLKSTKNIGCLTDILYIPRTHLIYTTSTEGYVVQWSDEPFQKSFMPSKVVQNKKLEINKIKLKDCCISVINTIHTKRRIIVVGDVQGEVSFYDITFRILYWCIVCANEPIVSIAFSCNTRRETVKRNLLMLNKILEGSKEKIEHKKRNYNKSSEEDDEEEDEEEEDEEVEEEEKKKREIMKKKKKIKMERLDKFKIRKPPSDATLQRKHFIAKNFIVSTAWGRILYIEYTKSNSETIYESSPVPLTSVVAHPYMSYVMCGNADGRLYKYDYKHKSITLDTKLKKEFGKDHNKAITCIGISSMGLELATGLENGSLHFYDPVKLIKEKYFFHNCNSAIRKIIFDKNSNYLVHTDDELCISLYGLGNIKVYMGKFKSHYEPITDILFTFKTSTLYSIGRDRKLVVYDVPEGFQGTLELRRQQILEQFAIPLAMTDYELDYDGVELLIIATDEFKYKIYHTNLNCFIKTALAPFLPSPIKMMQILPIYENSPDKTNFMVFGTNNEIGIQMFPVDGNPYKALAYVGSPTNLIGMSVSCDNMYLFTVSENDPSLLIWSVNKRAVRMSAHYGGDDLHPYYCLLEGGYNGNLLKEMKDFFYYSQIVHDGEFLTGTRIVQDKIYLCDVSNYFNALGYFPSTLEMQTALYEIRKNSTKKDTEIYITFEQVVKLFINHRPAKGVFERQLRDAFQTLARKTGEYYEIYKAHFTAGLLRFGEGFTPDELSTILETLLGKSSEDKSKMSMGLSRITPQYETILPEYITYEYFLDEILGIDTSHIDCKGLFGLFETQDKKFSQNI